MNLNKVLPLEQLLASNGYCDLTNHELKLLSSYAMLVNRLKNGKARYLEIDIFAGGTIKILHGLIPTLSCIGIDLFEDFVPNDRNTHISGTYRMADVQQFLGPEVSLIKGDSVPILRTLQGTFDLIFIDGNHTYSGCKADFEAAIPLMTPDGFVAFHNCSPHGEPDCVCTIR